MEDTVRDASAAGLLQMLGTENQPSEFVLFEKQKLLTYNIDLIWGFFLFSELAVTLFIKTFHGNIFLRNPSICESFSKN